MELNILTDDYLFTLIVQVPFFSWISLAMGGIPVDRQNRDKAVRTLKRAVDSARNSNIGFVIATEGTRSSTGHLQQFKKGKTYRILIVQHVMMCSYRSILYVGGFTIGCYACHIFGGYDLWPGKHWINSPGYIVVRYLDPIYPDDTISREKMLTMVSWQCNVDQRFIS
jgi:1-acyl-sn-glycerol-3-phosphate acyltransferase